MPLPQRPDPSLPAIEYSSVGTKVQALAYTVVPAKAGIHTSAPWMPASAGMTQKQDLLRYPPSPKSRHDKHCKL